LPLNRKGLSIPTEKLEVLLELPDNCIPGMAIDDGGCFFDSLAQCLNSIQHAYEHTEESLRKACHTFWMKNKEKVNALNEKEYGGVDKGDDYGFVQYTKDKLDKHFNKRTPIWGRPDIEGVMLCNELNLPAICIIELTKTSEADQLILIYCL